MEVKEISCPSCGAHVKIKIGEPVNCEYCNSTLYIENENDSASIVDKQRLAELEERDYRHRLAESERTVLLEKEKKWKKRRKIHNIAYAAATFFAALLLNDDKDDAGALLLLTALMWLLTETIVSACTYPTDNQNRNSACEKINRFAIFLKSNLGGLGCCCIGIVIAAIVCVI